nr:uncharacterized protein LOC109187971 [Ipomoea batatas]GMC74577.1 uncharacterized protein LOC109187971 [Ipomoea batatas]
MGALTLGSPMAGISCMSRKWMVLEVPTENKGCCGFPSFLPKEVHKIKDPFARTLAQRIQRLPVQVGLSEGCIMSSCVKPKIQSGGANPVVLLHCFDSSCLEWRCAYPLLEEAGLEAWAIDVLGWGFSDLARLPPCNSASKRYHLYQLWKTHIKRPMILVGPSLGAAVAIDFAVNFPEAASLLKSIPVRMYAKLMAFDGISLSTCIDLTEVSRLHCLLPWWKDATVNYMLSGGYNVVDQIKQRLRSELPNAIVNLIPKCGHLPHVEKPDSVAKLIAEFTNGKKEASLL